MSWCWLKSGDCYFMTSGAFSWLKRKTIVKRGRERGMYTMKCHVWLIDVDVDTPCMIVFMTLRVAGGQEVFLYMTHEETTHATDSLLQLLQSGSLVRNEGRNGLNNDNPVCTRWPSTSLGWFGSCEKKGGETIAVIHSKSKRCMWWMLMEQHYPMIKS